MVVQSDEPCLPMLPSWLDIQDFTRPLPVPSPLPATLEKSLLLPGLGLSPMEQEAGVPRVLPVVQYWDSQGTANMCLTTAPVPIKNHRGKLSTGIIACWFVNKRAMVWYFIFCLDGRILSFRGWCATREKQKVHTVSKKWPENANHSIRHRNHLRMLPKCRFEFSKPGLGLKIANRLSFS